MRGRVVVWIAGACVALGASGASGYAGYEARASCQIGFGSDADFSDALDVAEASLEAGIAGQGSFGDCVSQTNAATGELSTVATLSQVGGIVSGRTPTRGVARILERIYLTIPSGGTATVSASLPFTRGVLLEGGGTALAAATLDVNGCQVRSVVRAGGVEELVENCNLAQATADPASMSITLQIPKQWVQNPPNNFLELSAQLEAEVSTLEDGGTASPSAGGTLSVDVAGVTSWHLSNPSSLTVPEPHALGGALAAVAALASLRRQV